MPEYLFTGPDGRKYYASGADPESAFATAAPIGERDIAMLRRGAGRLSPVEQMQREVERGAEIRGHEEQRLSDPALYRGIAEAGARSIPGVDPLVEAAAGNWSGAAESATLQALPLAGRLPKAALMPALGAAGTVLGMGNTATAADEWDFIEDPKEREAAKAAYSKIRGMDRADTSRLRQQYITDLRKEIQGKREEKERGLKQEAAESDALKKFKERNAKSLGELTPDQRVQFDNRVVPGNNYETIKRQSEYLDQVARQREERGKTFAEKHATELEYVRGAAALAGVYIPTLKRARQIAALEEATKDAKAAFAAYTGGKATRSQTAELESTLAILRQNVEATGGNLAEMGKELGYGSLLPYTAATLVPNALEVGGRFATGTPEDRAIGMRALGNMADPLAISASVGEGLAATLGGQQFGTVARNAERAIPRGSGQLSAIEAFKAREAQDAASKAAAAAARKAEREAAKRETAAMRETRAADTARGEEGQRLSAADAAKRAFAETMAREEEKTAALVEQVERAQKQRKTKGPLTPAAGSPLAPGGGTPDPLASGAG